MPSVVTCAVIMGQRKAYLTVRIILFKHEIGCGIAQKLYIELIVANSASERKPQNN